MEFYKRVTQWLVNDSGVRSHSFDAFFLRIAYVLASASDVGHEDYEQPSRTAVEIRATRLAARSRLEWNGGEWDTLFDQTWADMVDLMHSERAKISKGIANALCTAFMQFLVGFEAEALETAKPGVLELYRISIAH